jgi:hypothetical protein
MSKPDCFFMASPCESEKGPTGANSDGAGKAIPSTRAYVRPTLYNCRRHLQIELYPKIYPELGTPPPLNPLRPATQAAAVATGLLRPQATTMPQRHGAVMVGVSSTVRASCWAASWTDQLSLVEN